MKKVYVIFLLIFAGFLSTVNAQIAAWNNNSLAGVTAGSINATTFNANLNTPVLSRGAGITATSLGGGYASSGWNVADQAAAISGNKYYQCTISALATYNVSLSTLDSKLRRTSTGPNVYIWRYSLDGTNFTDIGTAVSFTTTTTTGDVQPQINLSGIAALQNVASGTTITLRIYAWGATAAGGTLAFGTGNVNSLAFAGTVLSNSSTTITTGAVSAPPFCVDATNTASGTVAFTSTGTYTGETFTAKLSDAAGSFATPVNVGSTTVTGTDPSGTINITIPAGTTTGSGYRIRIDEGSIPITGSQSTAFNIVNGVLNVNAPAASVANSSSSLSWTNPIGCYTDVLIIAATAANTWIPTGTTYASSLIYGTGTPLGNGFAVYQGTGSPQIVTGLTNGTPYFYKFFTRLGSTWSAGIEVSATPAMVSSPTDYFRSVASGSWGSASTWQSSSDSSTWISATIEPGATAAHVVIQNPDSVWLNGFKTTPNLTVLSGAIVNALAFSITATSRFNLLGTASFYQGGASTPVPGVGVQQVLAATSNYHFNGTQAGTNAGAYPAFGNLFWEAAPTGGGTFQNSATIAPANLGLYIQGNMTINLQSAAQQEIRFATGASVTRSHVIVGNLNIISANSKVVVTNGGIGVRSTLAVGGNINISAGVLQGTSSTAATDGSASLNLSGNINNTGGTIQTGASTVGIFSLNYVGTSTQSINNTGGTFIFTANQLDSINNSSSTGLTLNTPITHSGTIRFIDGIVNTSATNLLVMAAGSSVTGASNASFVNGPVSKLGNTPFIFPIGKTNTGPAATRIGYAALGISNFTGGGPGDEFSAEYKRGNAQAMGPIAAPGLDHVSSCDYWTLTKDAGTAFVDITLHWVDSVNNCTTASPYVNNPPSLTVAHFNGTNWDAYGIAGNVSGTAYAGTVSWGIPQSTTFGIFAIGSIDFNNPLPITINYFNGAKQNGNHLLNWKVTCVSTPSATIELERSIDGRNYNSIYSIFATAVRCQQPFDYNDNSPAKGVNYYRLKMTDVDGKVTYSSIVSLINASKGIDVMNIAPNPIVNGAFNLKVSTAEKTQMELVVIDMQGRVMMKQAANMIAGFNVIPVNVKQLAAGTYQLFGNTADGRTRVLRFVVQ